MKINFHTILVILISFLLIIGNFVWLRIDTRPPHWDFAMHLLNTLSYLKYFDNKQIFNLLTYYHYYPPLSYYLTTLVYKFFLISEDVAVLSLTPYLIILIFSTYKIGQMLKNSKLGVLMVVLLAGMPFLMSQTREYQLDFPLTAMVTLNLCVFLKTDLLKNKKFSFFFGCFSGLAFLTKWTYLGFFVGMVVSSFIFDSKKNYFIKSKNIIIIIILVLLISGPWYLSNLHNLKNSFDRNVITAIEENDPNVLSIGSLLWYTNSLYRQHLRFPLLILSLIGLFFYFTNWKKYKKITLLLFIAFFYLFIMTLFRNKDARFIEPLTIIFVILVSFWVVELKNHLIRNFLIFFLILLSTFNYYISSFGFMDLPDNLESRLFNVNMVWYLQHGYTLGPPQKEKWYVKDVVDEMVGFSERAWFIFSQDKMFFNRNNIEYYRKLSAKNTYINTTIGKNECGNNFPHDYDYIIINDDVKNRITTDCRVVLKDFYKKKEFFLPDNSRLTIFDKKNYQ